MRINMIYDRSCLTVEEERRYLEFLLLFFYNMFNFIHSLRITIIYAIMLA